MSKRREFTTGVDAEIRKRAKDAKGQLRCELCGCAVSHGEVHHVKEDALEIDKSRKLTAADGVFACVPCHKELTRVFIPIIAKVRRVEAKALGASRPKQSIKQRPSQRVTRPHEGRQPMPYKDLYR